MKKTYPKIKFVYSLPYNKILAEYKNERFEEEKSFREIKNYIKKLESKWNKISNLALRALQEITKNKWQEKEIKCYVVKHFKTGGISAPLTLRMESDFDYVISVLIHELAHIIARYNFEKYKKILKKVKKKFPNKPLTVIRHIYINFIELQVLRKLFNKNFVNKILKKHLTLKGKEAWQIVLKNEINLRELFKR